MERCRNCKWLPKRYLRLSSVCPTWTAYRDNPAPFCAAYERKPWMGWLWLVALIIILTLALLQGGCALTTAEYKDGVASIRRIRVLMTEDIDSFSYDATDGSFILEGYKSDMTRLLILVDKLIARDAELRRELLALGVKP